MTKIISHISLIFSLLFYAISSGLFLHAFPDTNRRVKTQHFAFIFFILGTLTISIASFTSLTGVYYSQTSGLILITIVSILTIWSHFKLKIEMMGIFVAPIATLILLFLAFTYSPSSLHTSSESPHLLAKIHIGISILGQSFAITGFAIATMYLFQQRALKKKQLNFITKATPPLDKLEQSLMFSLWLGFIFLTLGLITGAIYLMFLSKSALPNVLMKIVWACSVWIWYLCILLAKNVFSQPGSVVAKMSVGGFILLLVTFFGLATWGGQFGQQ